MKGSILLRNY